MVKVTAKKPGPPKAKKTKTSPLKAKKTVSLKAKHAKKALDKAKKSVVVKAIDATSPTAKKTNTPKFLALKKADDGLFRQKAIKKRQDLLDAGLEEKRGVVVLSNIPHGFFEGEMMRFFRQFGVVEEIRLVRSIKTGQSCGYAYIEFQHYEVARIVAKFMDGYLTFGKIMKCKVIPPAMVTDRLFKSKHIRPENCPKLNIRKGVIRKMNKQRTKDQVNKRVARLTSTYTKKIKKLQELDIDLPLKTLIGTQQQNEDGVEDQATNGHIIPDTPSSHGKDNNKASVTLPEDAVDIKLSEDINPELTEEQKLELESQREKLAAKIMSHLGSAKKPKTPKKSGAKTNSTAGAEEEKMVLEVDESDDEVVLKTPPNAVKKYIKMGADSSPTATPKKNKTPKKLNMTPKTGKITPKKVKLTPKAVKGTPKEAKSPKEATGTPKEAIVTPKAVKTPKKANATPKAKLTPGMKKGTPEGAKLTPGMKKVTPKVAKFTSEVMEVTPKVAKTTPKMKKITPKVAKLTPEVKEVMEVTPEVANSTSGMEEVTPKVPKTTPGKKKATLNVGKTTPGIKKATPKVLKTAPGKKKVTPKATVMTPEAKEATPQVVEVTQEPTTSEPNTPKVKKTPKATPKSGKKTPKAKKMTPKTTNATLKGLSQEETQDTPKEKKSSITQATPKVEDLSAGEIDTQNTPKTGNKTPKSKKRKSIINNLSVESLPDTPVSKKKTPKAKKVDVVIENGVSLVGEATPKKKIAAASPKSKKLTPRAMEVDAVMENRVSLVGEATPKKKIAAASPKGKKLTPLAKKLKPKVKKMTPKATTPQPDIMREIIEPTTPTPGKKKGKTSQTPTNTPKVMPRKRKQNEDVISETTPSKLNRTTPGKSVTPSLKTPKKKTMTPKAMSGKKTDGKTPKTTPGKRKTDELNLFEFIPVGKSNSKKQKIPVSS